MKLLAIKERLEENKEFTNDSLRKLTVEAMVEFYKRAGFAAPWIGYFVEDNGELVGSAGFKGPPINGAVEIAYGTDEKYRQKGIGTQICKLLVVLSLKTDPLIKITARTFSESNYSTKILQNNQFVCVGTVDDPEDGKVWEWHFNPTM